MGPVLLHPSGTAAMALANACAQLRANAVQELDLESEGIGVDGTDFNNDLHASAE